MPPQAHIVHRHVPPLPHLFILFWHVLVSLQQQLQTPPTDFVQADPAACASGAMIEVTSESPPAKARLRIRARREGLGAFAGVVNRPRRRRARPRRSSASQTSSSS